MSEGAKEYILGAILMISLVVLTWLFLVVAGGYPQEDAPDGQAARQLFRWNIWDESSGQHNMELRDPSCGWRFVA